MRKCDQLLFTFFVIALTGCSGDLKDQTEGSSSGSGGTQQTGGTEPVTAQSCGPLPEAKTGNSIIIGPGQVGELQKIVTNAETGDTIFLRDGTYSLNGSYLWISTPGITLRSVSGNPEAVILDADYSSTEIITIAASNVTIAEISIIKPYTHAIHVTSSDAGDTLNTLIYRVNIVNPREQAIKINPHGGASGFYSDNGVIACSSMKLDDAGRGFVNTVHGGCYTGGVDGHQAKDWVIRDNHIEGFWCEAGLSEHAIHLWRGSRGTLVERNTLVNNARGVGFGLAASGAARVFDDNPCPEAAGAYIGHYEGIIRNNFIYANDQELLDSSSGFDGGISLWSACRAKAVHNTIVASDTRSSSIEWRFGSSQAIEVSNNIATSRLWNRDGNATLQNNIENAQLNLFVDAVNGDLHLNPDATAAIDQGVVLSVGLGETDFDQETRDGAPDIGADEFLTSP